MKPLANRWGVLPSQRGVAFAGFFSVGARAFRANATPLQTHFGGDDSHPSLIRQQYDAIRPYTFSFAHLDVPHHSGNCCKLVASG